METTIPEPQTGVTLFLQRKSQSGRGRVAKQNQRLRKPLGEIRRIPERGQEGGSSRPNSAYPACRPGNSY